MESVMLFYLLDIFFSLYYFFCQIRIIDSTRTIRCVQGNRLSGNRAFSQACIFLDNSIKDLVLKTFFDLVKYLVTKVCPAIEPAGNNTGYFQAVIQPFFYHLYGIHQGYETI